MAARSTPKDVYPLSVVRAGQVGFPDDLLLEFVDASYRGCVATSRALNATCRSFRWWLIPWLYLLTSIDNSWPKVACAASRKQQGWVFSDKIGPARGHPLLGCPCRQQSV
jgi:hypothetical protein